MAKKVIIIVIQKILTQIIHINHARLKIILKNPDIICNLTNIIKLL